MKYCDYCEKFVDDTFTVEIRHHDEAGRSGTVLTNICMNCILESMDIDESYKIINESEVNI